MNPPDINFCLVQKYLDVNLTKENPVLFYSRSSGSKTIEKFAAVKFLEAASLEGLPEYATLGKDCQVKMLTLLIKNLRGENNSENIKTLTDEDRVVAETAMHVAMFAEKKILAKSKNLDEAGVKLEKRALAQQLENHIQMIQGNGPPKLSNSTVPDDPAKAAQQYLGIDLSNSEPALRFVDSPPHIEKIPFDNSEGGPEVELQSREKQLMVQTHLISILKGETPLVPPKNWAPSEKLVIESAQNIAAHGMQRINELHGVNTAEAKEALKKLIEGLEQHLKGFGDNIDISRARRNLDNASPLLFVSGKVLETAKRYIETAPLAKSKIENLKPGQVVKLSRRLMTKERIASSVYIYRDFNGTIRMELKYHKSLPGKRGDSADHPKAILGEGAFNVVKRTLITENSPGVSKKPILKNESGIADQANEENATTRYRNSGLQNVFLPKAIGSVSADTDFRDIKSTGALKEVKGTLYPFADGGSLSSQLKDGVLTETQAHGYIKNILNGLAGIHGLKNGGMAHRDLKPDNILIMQGMAYIADHGTAVDPANREHNQRLPKSSNPLNSENVLYAGTPPYIAPEVVGGGVSSTLAGEKPANPQNIELNCIEANQRADMWAMGLILFQIMNTPTDKHNFPRGGPMALVTKCEKLAPQAQPGFTAHFDPVDYEKEFDQFRKNCEGRYTKQQVDLVLDCFSLDVTARPTAQNLQRAFNPPAE